MIMAWRDSEGWLDFVFCNDVRVVDEKERDGGWKWERCGGYERICEIRSTIYLRGLGRPRIGVITYQIGTCTYSVGDGKLTCTWNSLKSQCSGWFPPPPLVSVFLVLNSTIPKLKDCSLSLHAMIKSKHQVQHTPSTAYTKYSIHWVLHTLCTTSSQDRLSPAPSQSLISQQTMLYSILYILKITT